MAALRNVKKIESIVAINVSKYAILVKNVNNTHAKHKYLLNVNVGTDKLHCCVDPKALQVMEFTRKNKLFVIKNVKIWKDST